MVVGEHLDFYLQKFSCINLQNTDYLILCQGMHWELLGCRGLRWALGTGEWLSGALGAGGG